jgi:hypothetical protein
MENRRCFGLARWQQPDERAFPVRKMLERMAPLDQVKRDSAHLRETDKGGLLDERAAAEAFC